MTSLVSRPPFLMESRIRADVTEAVIPGQQLYLHTAYDDGWSLCEDQNEARGVVPLSCLEPWQENQSLIPR